MALDGNTLGDATKAAIEAYTGALVGPWTPANKDARMQGVFRASGGATIAHFLANPFTATVPGLVPATGLGTPSAFVLRADGTWGSAGAATLADGNYGDVSVGGSGTNIQISPGVITDLDVAAANRDGVAGTASLRTLGSGAQQAAAGNHNHTGTYAAASHSHLEADVTGLALDLAGKVPASRALTSSGLVKVGGGTSADLSADRAITLESSAAARVAARKTAGAGAFEEVTASDVLDFLTSTRGSVLYRGSSGWAGLAPGTAGYVLVSGGAGADPSWSASIPAAGSTSQVQYSNSGNLGGAANVEISSGHLALVTGTPGAPSSGRVAVFGLDVGGRHLPAFRDPLSTPVALQPHQGLTKRLEWIPQGNSNVLTTIGSAAGTVTGTATARAVAAGALFTWSRRIGYVSTSATGSTAGICGSAQQFGLGDVAGAGGFHFLCRFGTGDVATVANSRFFVGLAARVTAIPNAEPSAQVNLFGVGCDAGQTTMRTINNDGSGTATTSNLGANFPTQTLSTDLYQLAMWCAPNSSTVYWQLRRLNTVDVASGSWSSDLPLGSTLLAPQIWRNNGTTALSVGIDLFGLYIDSDL